MIGEIDGAVLELDTGRDLEPGIASHDYGPASPVPIFQHEFEFERLLELYRAREPWSVLEIGTYHGGSLFHWLTALDNPPELVVAVDSYATGVDNRALYPAWTSPKTELVVLEADSRSPDTVATVRDLARHSARNRRERADGYAWVWIDAGHFYAEVRDDFENYGSLVEPGGIVAFHDILPTSPEHPEIQVEQLWREIQRAGFVTQEIVHDRRNSWGGIGVVYA